VTRNSATQLKKYKCHQPSAESTSQSSSFSSKGQKTCFMSKENKRKKTKKNESESEEDDFEFDKLSKKHMIKIMKFIERIPYQELQLKK
jgi:hypothetical protein